MAASDPIVVIGGGLGGLASAIVLRARGYPVILFEHNQWLGGKAAELRLDGFRFDMGPTVLTVPSVLTRIFEEAGRNAHEVLDLVRLNPQWRCFFEDGSVLDLVEDTGAMSRKIEEYAPGTGSGDGYRRLLELSRKLHDISQRFFFWRSVEGLADTMDLKASLNAATMRDVLNLRMGATVAGTIRRHVPDERVAQMLDHFVQYVGSSPFNSPAVLCAIAHMQADGGVWYPRGGTKQIPASLQELARAIGVEIHTGTGVNRIVVENGRAVAVQNDRGERIGANAVVSNMDAVRTYRDLIGGDIARRFERRRRYEPACSGIVFYLGLSRRYDHLLHHSFVFSRDAKEEFEAIYRRGEPAPDPTCYLAAPARSEPEVAPPGGEALYVLVHTPYLRRHHDWRRMLPEYRRVIYDKLARTAGMDDLEQRIVCQAVLTPQDIHDRYRVLNGAIYGLASHGRFFGAFKPGNRRDDIRGLYLAGSPKRSTRRRRRCGASRPRHADGADVGLDRGGHPRQRSSPWGTPGLGSGRMNERRELRALLAVDPVAARSPLMVAFFARVMAQAMTRDFHAVRISGNIPEPPASRPAVIYANHPSWWDPALFAVLTKRCFPDRQGYGPIDIEALARYRFMSRIGLFGIESSSRLGRRFLRTSLRVLDDPRSLLWITPEGRFADPRERPVQLRPGLAHLARRAQHAIFVPMAVEYVFWTERQPEALCQFGVPLDPSTQTHLDVSAWSALLQRQLTETMDALAKDAVARDPLRFRVLLRGRSGIGGVYDLWRRARAILRQERFRPEHGRF